MPFAGYKDFADCVAKNRDKDDPQAYCAAIEHKLRTGTLRERVNQERHETSEGNARPEKEAAPKANQHTGWWKGHL